MGAYAGPAQWWTDNTDPGRTHIATKGVVQNGIVQNLDAGVSSSYPGSGTTWTDISGQNINGTLTNGPTYSSTNGGYIIFDGTDDYVDTGYSVNNTNFTLDFWYKPLTDRTSTEIIAGKATGFTGDSWWIGIDVPGNFVVKFAENAFSVEGTTVLSFGSWYHITVVKQGATQRSIYINGSLEASSESVACSPGGNITLGRWGSLTFYHDCHLAAFKIYNRVLTTTEIALNFNAMRGRFGI